MPSWRLALPGGQAATCRTAPQDASLEGADPVIWYAFGVTHVVRPEDFPVMPCEWVAALAPELRLVALPGWPAGSLSSAWVRGARHFGQQQLARPPGCLRPAAAAHLARPTCCCARRYVGFHLKPFGFFARNPALDVPPEVNGASKKCSAANGTSSGATNGCH